MVSAKTLLNYPYWTITFTVHTNASDKQLDAVVSHNNKLLHFSQVDYVSHYVTAIL